MKPHPTVCVMHVQPKRTRLGWQLRNWQESIICALSLRQVTSWFWFNSKPASMVQPRTYQKTMYREKKGNMNVVNLALVVKFANDTFLCSTISEWVFHFSHQKRSWNFNFGTCILCTRLQVLLTVYLVTVISGEDSELFEQLKLYN